VAIKSLSSARSFSHGRFICQRARLVEGAPGRQTLRSPTGSVLYQ
jgi:hypothetical protein